MAPLTGEVEVVIQLEDLSLSSANGRDAKKNGRMLPGKEQRRLKKELDSKQSGVMGEVAQLGGREVARLTNALNAVIVSIDASKIDALTEVAGVVSVRRIGDYEMDLSETVPYIGAAAAQVAGIDGTGVTVAVIDSGIDYTHKNLGGEGTEAAYLAAWGTYVGDPKQTETEGLFPTAKVTGGYDFVGELWPFADRTEDPDPIDLEGHGTHVADIIAGKSLDGMHVGVAPGASLYAIKACSAVATSCNGVALLLAVEYALDPNGDGDLSDAVDVINMSLGSSYGQIEDDLSLAAANAARLGVVVVASAGNSADRPYITGSPASTPEVISVAQTEVPSSVAVPLVTHAPEAIAGSDYNNTLTPWAPLVTAVTANVVYDLSNRLGANPFLIDLTGKAVLIDRGDVSFVTKVANAANAGAALVIVANNAGDPIPMGGAASVPPYPPAIMISTSAGTAIKTALGFGETVSVSIDPSGGLSLAGSVVASSSRGPNISFNAIKPDVGAPGASVSAIAGSGDGVEAFGGTSGAAPMVSGSAALLLEAYPKATVGEIKARLMNTGETHILTNPATQPGVLAPITRIGGGEIRVDQAIATMTTAWAEEKAQDKWFSSWGSKADRFWKSKKEAAYSVSLSFGFNTVPDKQKLEKFVTVTNHAEYGRVYRVTPTFRYEDDAASEAVSMSAPRWIWVRKNSSATFKVTLYVDGSRLPEYILNGGSLGGIGQSLEYNEFDGYLVIADKYDNVHVPWQVLPHRAAAVKLDGGRVNLNRKGNGTFKLSNKSRVLDGDVEVFDLLGSSDRIKKKYLPGPGDNLAIIDLKSVGAAFLGFDGGGFPVGGIAISTYGRRAHPNYPAGFEIDFYIDDDDIPDYIVYNSEAGTFASTGQNVVFQGPPEGPFNGYFYSDAQLNSGNIVLPFYLDELPNWGEDGATVRMEILAYDNYFTGIISDVIEVEQYTFGLPKYYGGDVLTVEARKQGKFPVIAVPGGDEASPSQSGLLLMYRNGADNESDEVLIK